MTIAIRPEDIRVQGGQENALEARVEAMAFLGAFFRADLVGDAIGDARLRADLSGDVVRRLNVAEGRTLPVIIPKRRLRVYPRGAIHS